MQISFVALSPAVEFTLQLNEKSFITLSPYVIRSVNAETVFQHSAYNLIYIFEIRKSFTTLSPQLKLHYKNLRFVTEKLII